MNISIFASIGAQNIGDELILKNEIELLRQEFSSKRPVSRDRSLYFRVASYDPKNPIFQIQNTQYFEYFPLGIKQIKNIFRNIRNFFKLFRVIIWSDIVVVGGGGIIYDSEVQSVGNPLDQWIFRVKIARFFRKKIYFYAVGIDITQENNFEKLKKIFKNAWKITVRDEKSQKQLESIGIKSEIVNDPVMNENIQKLTSESPLFQNRGEQQKTEPSFSSGRERIQDRVSKGGVILGIHHSKNFKLKDFEKYDFSGKKVGLALRSGYIGTSGDSRIEKLLVEELCQYIEKQGGRIIFLPHSLHSIDIYANDYEFMKQFLNYDREIYVSLGEVYTAYNHKMLDVVISMRLHSIILSHVYGIDQVVLSYSQKTEELIKKLQK